MAEKFYTILTNIGKASIANASALGQKVDFKYMALGDGNGSYYNPDETQLELRNEVYRSQINHIQMHEDNPSWITLSIIAPANVGGFFVREVGVFDTENNLIAVSKVAETYKPRLEDGSSKDLTINMILEVSNTSVVTLKVDPSVILATKKQVDDLAGAGRTKETVKDNADKIKTKVDKVTGKGLSANDYTDEEKQKVQKIKEDLGLVENDLITVEEDLGSHLAEFENFKSDTNITIEEIEKQIANYNSYSSEKDDNGIFTVVEYKRADSTLYMKSTLGNPDAEGNYQTMTWEFYNELGDTIIDDVTWTMTYDEDGNVVSKVVSV